MEPQEGAPRPGWCEIPAYRQHNASPPASLPRTQMSSCRCQKYVNQIMRRRSDFSCKPGGVPGPLRAPASRGQGPVGGGTVGASGSSAPESQAAGRAQRPRRVAGAGGRGLLTGAAPPGLNHPGRSQPCRSWNTQPRARSSWGAGGGSTLHNGPDTPCRADSDRTCHVTPGHMGQEIQARSRDTSPGAPPPRPPHRTPAVPLC